MLLTSDCASELLPSELLGLTDRPPGNTVPGEKWWPSVGCGPIGEWWGIWLTSPDENTTRGGMVHSEVALWPLDNIGSVEELNTIILELSSKANIQEPSKELITALLEALLSGNSKPPVILGVEAIPGIIMRLWPLLWPEARRSFSARVAISPPQSSGFLNPPWFFGVLPGRAPQWVDYQIVSSEQCPLIPSRATRWLVYGSDSYMDEVFAACKILPLDLSELNRFARAADRLEQVRKSPEPELTISFLRTIILLAPDALSAASLKRETLSLLKTNFIEGDPLFVLSVANLDPINLPAGEVPELELATWISLQMPNSNQDNVVEIFERLSENSTQEWWQRAVTSTLTKQLSKPNKLWSIAALKWIGLPDGLDILDNYLHNTKENEECLLSAADKSDLSTLSLNKIRKEAVKRKWARLHSWVVMKTLPECDAIVEQGKFPGNPYPGLEFLVARLSGAAITEAAIAGSDSKFIDIVSKRTAKEPELLGALDASISSWRMLWASHIKHGGVHWPTGTNKIQLGQALLDAVQSDDVPDGLIGILADDLVDIAISYPQREVLWQRLEGNNRTILLSSVADSYIRLYDSKQSVPTPEHELAISIADKARTIHPPARLIAALLTWNVNLEETEVIQWLSGINSMEWKPVAGVIGSAILKKNWHRVANHLYHQFQSTPELQPAVNACKDLLSWWDRGRFSFYTGGSLPAPDDLSLTQTVAELGATLAPDQLQYIWERAGGHRKQLSSSGTPETQWYDAATQANNGKIEGGLPSLVRELLIMYPNNSDLIELQAII